MKERPNIAVEEDTKEMKRWRGLSQRMEEEVLDKYKVEESKKGAFKGRGDPRNGKEAAEARNIILESGEKTAGQEFFLVERIQFTAFAKQAGGASRRGGDEAAAKDGHHEISDKENQTKRKDGCQKNVAGSRSCLRRIVRKHGPTQGGRTPRRNGMTGWNT